MSKCLMVFQFDDLKKSMVVSEFPSIGQLIDIENLKITLSGGKYNEMARSPLKSMTFALDLIDAISCFTILNPVGFNAVFKELIPKGKTIMDVPASKSRSIVDQYNKKFLPWYKPLMAEIYSAVATDESEEEDVFDIDEDLKAKN